MLVIVELLLAGGMFMFGILATSLVAVGIIAQRVFTLWIGFRINVGSLREKVLAYVDDGDYGKAAQLCEGKHPLQRMMLAAIERANRGEKEIRRSVETCAITELARFRRGTASLPQLSNLATLLGLLGTIHGLIISFSGMQAVDAAARQAALSKGVAVAFYNTFFGLTVATVTVVAYLLVSAKQGRELVRMEAATSTLVDRLLVASDSHNATQRPGSAGAR
jgi:biopolymer transport protein ExbB